jgi:hypothetical protein
MRLHGIAAWSALVGLLAGAVALVSFATGVTSLPQLFASASSTAASPRGGGATQEKGAKQAAFNLDMINGGSDHTYPLPSPIAFGSNNAFLANYLLVRRFGEGAGIHALQCGSDRQCAGYEVENADNLAIEFSEFSNNELIVFAEEAFGETKFTPKLTDASKGMGTYLGNQTGHSSKRLIWIDFGKRMNGWTYALFSGCIYNGVDGTLEKAEWLGSARWRLSFDAGCSVLLVGGVQAHTKLTDGLGAKYVAEGQFDRHGEFVASSLTGSVSR